MPQESQRVPRARDVDERDERVERERKPAVAAHTRGVAGIASARAALALVALLALAGACERKTPPPHVDSVVSVAPPPAPGAPATPPLATSSWTPDAGSALLVRGPQGEALVVVPGTSDGRSPADTGAGAAAGVLPAEVALFTRGGPSGRARAALVPTPESGRCSAWPHARLGPATGADVMPPWTVGLAGGSATALPLDSLEGLASADSAALAAEVTRLAAADPATGSDAFRGLPFVVKSALRFAPDSATHAVVAVLARHVPGEAKPRAEQLLLVAERAAGAGARAPYALAYTERVVGEEETLQTTDVLAALRVGERATLVLAREFYEGSRYALLERAAPRTWRLRWASVYRGC